MKTHLSDHSLGQNFCSLGSADDVSSFEEDLGSIRHRFKIPFPSSGYRGLNGFIYQLLQTRANHDHSMQNKKVNLSYTFAVFPHFGVIIYSKQHILYLISIAELGHFVRVVEGL